ncbi:MAG: WG repeat-containing protein, partial [Bacillota bacterium]|nr:WG repeat-containing protein [Bacillota bacterium]
MKKYILFLILIILFLVPLSVLATDEMEYRIDVLQCGKDMRFDGQYFYVETKDEKLVILNTKMEQIIGPVYNYTTRNFSEGMLIVSQTTEESGKKQTRYGAIDLNGNLKVDFLFSQLYDFENGKAQGLLGENAVFVDRTGNIIRDFGKHGYFGKFVNGYAFVRDELIDGKSFFGEQLTFYYDLIGNPTSSECEAVTGKA